VERAQPLAAGLPLVGGGGLGTSALGYQLHDGVELAVHSVDGGQAGVDGFARRKVAGPDARREGAGAVDHRVSLRLVPARAPAR